MQIEAITFYVQRLSLQLLEASLYHQNEYLFVGTIGREYKNGQWQQKVQICEVKSSISLNFWEISGALTLRKIL